MASEMTWSLLLAVAKKEGLNVIDNEDIKAEINTLSSEIVNEVINWSKVANGKKRQVKYSPNALQMALSQFTRVFSRVSAFPTEQYSYLPLYKKIAKD
jgi:hypothetical protein